MPPKNDNNKKEEEETPINVPPRVPATDALGKPIDPPNVAEPGEPLVVTFKDTQTDDTIWQTPFVPLPAMSGRQFTIDLYIEGNRVHHMYYIDHIDKDTKTVFMTLNKVYVNDNPQFSLS